MNGLIEACIVNHNSSIFAELALRSLIANHPRLLADNRLRVTIVDNHSSDHELEDLMSTCDQLGAAFERSAWPLSTTQVNSHGDVMRRFVAKHPAASHFLFVDADTYCLADGTVDRMAEELAADPELWAVQARFSWIEENLGPGQSFDLWTGRIQQLRASIDGADVGPYPGQHKARCHPAFALVANTPIFRRVADVIGLSAAMIISSDPALAGFADTFGLATLAMQTHNLKHALSQVTVGHYHGVTYSDPTQPLGGKLDDCRARLTKLRVAQTPT